VPDFFTLFWLCVGAGVLATGFGTVLIAWHAPAFVAVIRDLVDAVRDLANATRSLYAREDA
jgi:hypothetical protein